MGRPLRFPRSSRSNRQKLSSSTPLSFEEPPRISSHVLHFRKVDSLTLNAFGRRAFSSAAPQIWSYHIPTGIRVSPSLDSFNSELTASPHHNTHHIANHLWFVFIVRYQTAFLCHCRFHDEKQQRFQLNSRTFQKNMRCVSYTLMLVVPE